MVELVACLEVRRRAMLHAQTVSPYAEVLADDHPGWWCPSCHAGGVLIKAPE